MELSEERLVAKTCEILGWKGRAPELVPILKGGSDRRFYRVLGGEQDVILMVFGGEREENQYYARIGRFLADIGVPVPAILADDPADRLVWSEDLGAVDIHAMRERPWEELLGIYRLLIEQMVPFYLLGAERAEETGVPMMPGFDDALYAWERDYFYREFVGGVCGITLADGDRTGIEAELAPLAVRLGSLSPCLVHRDFQSQNVMVREERPWVIDFQGMRRGTFFYDLASLFMDPYMALDAAKRGDLERIALESGLWKGSRDEFRLLLDAAAVQRLMQALGAYGFLGLKKEKKAFLAHIPAALRGLKDAASRLESGGSLCRLLEVCENNRRF